MMCKRDWKWNSCCLYCSQYHSTSTTTQPTLPWPHPQQGKKKCSLWRQFSLVCFMFSYEHRLDYQALFGKGACVLFGEERRPDSREWRKSSVLWTLSTIICGLWHPSSRIIYSSNKTMYSSQCLLCHTNIAKCHIYPVPQKIFAWPPPPALTLIDSSALLFWDVWMCDMQKTAAEETTTLVEIPLWLLTYL